MIPKNTQKDQKWEDISPKHAFYRFFMVLGFLLLKVREQKVRRGIRGWAFIRGNRVYLQSCAQDGEVAGMTPKICNLFVFPK